MFSIPGKSPNLNNEIVFPFLPCTFVKYFSNFIIISYWPKAFFKKVREKGERELKNCKNLALQFT